MKNQNRYLLLVLFIASLLTLPAAAPAGAQAPVQARFTYSPSEPVEKKNVTFDAGGSVGSNLTYKWDFGDGTWATGPVVVHVYNDSGWYDVALEASDGSGNWAVCRERIHVEPDDQISLGAALLVLLLVVVIFVVSVVGLTLMLVIVCILFVVWFIELFLAVLFASLMDSKARREGYKGMHRPYRNAMAVLVVVSLFLLPLSALTLPFVILLFVKFHLDVSSQRARDRFGPPEWAKGPGMKNEPSKKHRSKGPAQKKKKRSPAH